MKDYLKYWRVVRYFIKAKYNLSQADLDIILFLYSEKYFSKDDFVKLELIKTIEDLRDAHYESIDNNLMQIQGKAQRTNLIVRKAREG